MTIGAKRNWVVLSCHLLADNTVHHYDHLTYNKEKEREEDGSTLESLGLNSYKADNSVILWPFGASD